MPETVRMMFGADLFPTERIVDAFRSGDLGDLVDGKIRDLLKCADYTVFNLEGCLTDAHTPIHKVDPIIRAPTDAVRGFAQLPISCFALANNHIMDYGPAGYADTRRTLADAGYESFGAGDREDTVEGCKIVAINGIRIGLYNVAETMFNIPGPDRPGANLYDPVRVCGDIRRLKAETDHVVVIYHGGTEFFWYTNAMMRARLRGMADAGADLVLTQHTHCIAPQEDYHGSRLLYGQGDFWFPRHDTEYKKHGLLIDVTFTKDSFSAERHLLIHEGNRVALAEPQDLSAFDERSLRQRNGDAFDAEYAAYADEKITKFLRAFRGKNLLDKVLYKLLPRPKFAAYLKSRYTERQLLRILSAVRFEEFNDLVRVWLETRLDKTE